MTETETETENPIEEKKTATAKFAEWLMKRDERRQEKESNLEGLMKFNTFLSGDRFHDLAALLNNTLCDERGCFFFSSASFFFMYLL